MRHDVDVVVVGAGPAGRAVARACAQHELRTLLVDPRPEAPWRQTYGAWCHEIPESLPPSALTARARGVAIGRRVHELGDPYGVLDTAALQAHLTHPDVEVRTARVVGVRAGPAVELEDGTTRRARVVVDATGARQALATRRPAAGPRAEQTAYGLVVPREVAAAVTGDRLVFMDWRPRHGRDGWPTFLYAVPLDAQRVLLEETSLVRRPGLPLAELRERLGARLRAAGLGSSDEVDGAVEKVRFPVDTARHRSPAGVVAVGAAAPVMHPATGFSVATSLALAPRIAGAIAAGGPDPAGAARRVVWSRSAVTVDAMRRRGLATLLALPPAQVPEFFDRFFALPEVHRRAYLGARDDVGASLAAMLALFGQLTPRLRGHLIRGTFGAPGGVRTDQ